MIEKIALLLTLAGGFVSILPKLIARLRERRQSKPKGLAGGRHIDFLPSGKPQWEPATRVLAMFAMLTTLFAAMALWHYWSQVKALGDVLFLAGGLLLMMIGGMFVQVLTSNYGEGKNLVQVSASRLLYPLLFSPIVFYPIWLVGNREGARLFSFYAAFLNGYFWQSVVAAAKKPEPPVDHN